MDKEFSRKLFIGVLIFLFFAIALLYRVALPYDAVFTPEGIKFTSNDAYFHMRIVDSLVQNFPHATEYDPYLIYPGGGGLAPTFMDWFLALIILIIGLGSPSQHIIDVVGVYFPAVLAALTVVPVFFIGKALFNRWVGVIAAALTAVLPGEFIGRTILGFTDNHVAETFFSTVAALFVILAVKNASEKQLTLGHFAKRDWKTITRPLIHSILAGIFLALYLITWQGGLMFVFIITAYFIVQFIIDHLKRRSTEYLGITGFLIFLVSLIIFLPFSPSRDFSASGVIAMCLPPVMMGVSMLMSRYKIHPIFYPLALAVIGGAFIGIFYAAEQPVFTAMINKFKWVFLPGGATATTTLEMQPFLYPQGGVFSTKVAWGNFTTSFFLLPNAPIPGFAFISLIILVVLFIKNKANHRLWMFLFVWTLVILIATLAQRRFAYYLVINIAVLSAFFCWQVIWLAGLRRLLDKQDETKSIIAATARDKKKKKHEVKRGFSIHSLFALIAAIAVFFLILFPNILKSKEVAGQALFAPSDAWQSSLAWMRDNTPEPMGDPDAYNLMYERPKRGESFEYPESAYGVTAWWDYGYWITRIARRIPNTNPSQDPGPIKKVSDFFLSNDESSARQILTELGSSYIVIDYDICTVKLWAIVTWAGKPQDEFLTVYYMPYQGKLVPVQAFKPAFYQTVLARLYCFDGKAVTQVKPVVLTYEERVDKSGVPYKLISGFKELTDYQEALDYVAVQPAGKHDIIGVSPFNSPIPLEALEGFELVHGSANTRQATDTTTVPEIKIFKYSAE